MIVQLCEACIDTDIDLNYVSSDFMKPAHKWQFSLLKFDIHTMAAIMVAVQVTSVSYVGQTATIMAAIVYWRVKFLVQSRICAKGFKCNTLNVPQAGLAINVMK